jgi:RNA recognition motif-containing protein
VRNLKMSRDLFSGECRGFAELDMEGHEARKAIAALNGSTVEGEALRVGLKSELKSAPSLIRIRGLPGVPTAQLPL